MSNTRRGKINAVLALILWFGIGFLLTRWFLEANGSAITGWVERHATTTELITVWALALGFSLFALVKLVSWSVLRRQADQTGVGSSLKWQKLAEAALGLAMSTLYALTLAVYYGYLSPGVWLQTLIRAGLFIGIVAASVYGGRFVYHLMRESRRERVGAAPLALQASDDEGGDA